MEYIFAQKDIKMSLLEVAGVRKKIAIALMARGVAHSVRHILCLYT